MSQLSVERAAQLPGEDALLAAVVADLAAEEPRRVYADWLEEQGDAQRAAVLRGLADAMTTMEGFPEAAGSWARTIGLTLIAGIAEHGLTDRMPTLLGLAEPALSWTSAPAEDAAIPVGGTKLWGRPDLPRGMAWPTAADCRQRWDEDVPLDGPCGFVAQLNLAELAGTCAAGYLPGAGLLSVFAFEEIDEHGTVWSRVYYFPDVSALERRDAPAPIEEDEANFQRAPEVLTVVETLDIPDAYDSPWTDEIGEVDDGYYQLRDTCCSEELQGMLGYTRATSGSDPSPDTRYRKLFCLESPLGMMLHFVMRSEDLATGNFDGAELAWVDFD